MTLGAITGPEWKRFPDPVTGAQVTRLTGYLGHSYAFYFTNPGWYAGGHKLLFGSDRSNRTNLYSIDLRNGAIRQLTDLPSFDALPPFEEKPV